MSATENDVDGVTLPNVPLTNMELIHCVRMKSSTQQKVSQLVENCKYLPEMLNSITVTIFTRDPKAVLKYS